MDLYRFEFAAMASACEIQVWAGAAAAHAAARAAIADVRRIEAKYSRYRDDSLTTRINRAAGRAPVPIDRETAALLEYGEVCHRLSAGAFDLTAGVLRRAWDFRRVPPRVPSRAELDDLVRLIGWDRVERTAHTVFLPAAGMELDFGGIGKEYAADRAATLCTERGIAHGLVNLGGDVRVIGPQPGGVPWRVGIRDPCGPGAIGVVTLSEGALATSGDYERRIEVDGVRYGHILDARTGMPAATFRSISVCADVCIVAGTYATIAMLQGAAAPAFLAAEGVEHGLVDAAGRCSGTLFPPRDETIPRTRVVDRPACR